ncbi:hypothetical protein [Streptomyces sp. NBC_01361]|uniref:hypothetical protein n=1 Tax=Streptomyces sp. NBC_01361 TaxID=2903838 RepID=UPI002E3734DF|nr:hypothetical protein [Streptomyces sp. NBC_01361]
MSGGGSGTSERGVLRALRRYQARLEPVVTRVLLLGIFVTGLVAQFVKPVGDALEGKAFLGGALLSLVGYVLYDAVKELTASVRLPARPLVSSSDLGGFVSEAFRRRKVEISFLGYTGETLYNEVYHRLEKLLDDPGPTKRVSIRVMVPDFGRPMTVPSRVGVNREPVDDPEFRRRIELKCQEYDRILSGLSVRLNDLGRVSVECEYRLYPGIPRDKICIFNRRQALHGLYDVAARSGLYGPDPEFYDPKGYNTELHVWAAEGVATGDSPVSMWAKHFDALWSLGAEPSWRPGAAT